MPLPRRVLPLLLLVTLLTTGFAAPPCPDPAAVARAKELATPGMSGANDWGCRPSRRHPRPVVLVHGTFANGTVWADAVPRFTRAGYCVFVLDYGKTGAPGMYGMGPIADSAKELAAFVDGVRAATGAGRVDIVGHSQGGMMPRQYMRFEGGARRVHTLVGLAPSNRGTTLDLRDALADERPELAAAEQTLFAFAPCQACTEQLAGSDFLTKLNAGGPTLPGVTYAVAATKYDFVVTPYKSQFLPGSSPRVHNQLVQDACLFDFALHSTIQNDPVALRFALNALDPAHAEPLSCSA
ncbi:lipase family alpha/beta hydrolase [Streptomyces sp. NPDC050085]|uniref:lipase family alpha/beta hydrolase n=1 Tax=Streptomyces sp. NPDC050085 TaxID=3365600 RepID=UPI00378AE142